MIITVLLLLLVVSFFIHISFMTLYIVSGGTKKKHLINFFITAIVNFCFMVALSYIAIKSPHLIQELDIKLLLWVISGIVMVFTFLLKVLVFCRIRKRQKNPDNYHYNFFGKKVYHLAVVRKIDLAIIFLTLPFFLLVGSYFIARLLNIIFYGHI